MVLYWPCSSEASSGLVCASVLSSAPTFLKRVTSAAAVIGPVLGGGSAGFATGSAGFTTGPAGFATGSGGRVATTVGLGCDLGCGWVVAGFDGEGEVG